MRGRPGPELTATSRPIGLAVERSPRRAIAAGDRRTPRGGVPPRLRGAQPRCQLWPRRDRAERTRPTGRHRRHQARPDARAHVLSISSQAVRRTAPGQLSGWVPARWAGGSCPWCRGLRAPVPGSVPRESDASPRAGGGSAQAAVASPGAPDRGVKLRGPDDPSPRPTRVIPGLTACRESAVPEGRRLSAAPNSASAAATRTATRSDWRPPTGPDRRPRLAAGPRAGDALGTPHVSAQNVPPTDDRDWWPGTRPLPPAELPAAPGPTAWAIRSATAAIVQVDATDVTRAGRGRIHRVRKQVFFMGRGCAD